MKCETKIVDKTAILLLDGKLVCSALNELHEIIGKETNKEGVEHYALNLGKVKIMDSAGIGFILSMSRNLAAKGFSFCIINPTRSVEQSLEVIGATRIVPIYHSEEQALKALPKT